MKKYAYLLTLVLAGCGSRTEPGAAEKSATVSIGGQPVVTLEVPRPADANTPAFLKAEVLPGRGMNTFQITAQLPGKGDVRLLEAPSIQDAMQQMNGGPDDVNGNKSFAFGGAILVPYANRIRGKLSADGKTIEANILGKQVTLPANWGGKKPGAQKYAMHGLMLASKMDEVKETSGAGEKSVTGVLHAGDFGSHWLSKMDVTTKVTLRNSSFDLLVTTTNTGTEPSPVGIGWHPYFALPSGKREQAKLHLPALKRAPANNYDEVLPTGEIVPVAGTEFDFSAPGGKALEHLYMDDNFTGLQKTPEGFTVSEIIDPAAKYGLRITAISKEVNAIQIYAPPDKSFVVLEPQFNLADPFSPVWKGKVNTGMVTLKPGESVTYTVRLEMFVPQ
jgi:galactose mutarotase-like enzyme